MHTILFKQLTYLYTYFCLEKTKKSCYVEFFKDQRLLVSISITHTTWKLKYSIFLIIVGYCRLHCFFFMD